MTFEKALEILKVAADSMGFGLRTECNEALSFIKTKLADKPALSITHGEDGYWLRIDTPGGKHSGIHLDSGGTIVDATLREVAIELGEKPENSGYIEARLAGTGEEYQRYTVEQGEKAEWKDRKSVRLALDTLHDFINRGANEIEALEALRSIEAKLVEKPAPPAMPDTSFLNTGVPAKLLGSALPVVSPERIATLKKQLQWAVDVARMEKEKGYPVRQEAAMRITPGDCIDILAILSAYATQGEAQVTDEERREMLIAYGLMRGACSSESGDVPYCPICPQKKRCEKIRALILSPAKTVSQEWVKITAQEIWIDETIDGAEDRFEKALRDLGIVVEPEKAEKK